MKLIHYSKDVDFSLENKIPGGEMRQVSEVLFDVCEQALESINETKGQGK